MKILAISKSAISETNEGLEEFDFAKFSNDLRDLSNFYGITIVNLGAISSMDSDDGVTYLAVWNYKKNGLRWAVREM